MNKIFMTAMRLGLARFGGELPEVLTVPGRKSGKPRSTPITPFTVDGKRYVVGGFPGADWVRNVRAAGVVTLTKGRQTQAVRAVELSAEDARPLLRAFPRLGTDGCQLHEERRPGHRGQARRVRGARRPVRCLPIRPPFTDGVHNP